MRGTHELFGEALPFEFDLSTTVACSAEVLRARFCAGSARSALGGADAMEANCRDDI